MNMYEKIFEKLQERVETGELTMEDAERLNERAYEKYVIEKEEGSKDENLVNSLLEKVQNGYKLPKKLKECIEDAVEEEDKSDDEKSDDGEESSDEEPEAEAEE